MKKAPRKLPVITKTFSLSDFELALRQLRDWADKNKVAFMAEWRRSRRLPATSWVESKYYLPKGDF